MVQLEVELGPLAIGFGFGAVLFLHKWVFPAYSRKAKELLSGAALQAEPLAEPVPEPSPRAEAPDQAGRRQLQLAGATLVLLLLATSVAAGGLRGAAPAEPVALDAPAAAVAQDTLPVPVAPAVQAPVAPAEPATTATQSALEAPAAPAEPVAEPAPAVVPHPAAVPSAEPPAKAELSAEPPVLAAKESRPRRRARKEKQPADPNVMTLNLTRQEMVMQAVDDIIFYKSAYWGTLSIGTPAVPFKVVFDTGSGHLIVPSTYCHSTTCRAHKRYRRSVSTSAKDIDYDGTVVMPGDPRDQITVNFGTGEVTGVFIEDVICGKNAVGMSWEQEPPRCMPMRMIAATDMSEEPFRTFEFDGVVGMGLKGLSQAPEFNFLHVMGVNWERQGARTPSMFAVYLAEDDQQVSQITLGGYDDERLEGDIFWNPVLNPEEGHWMVRIAALRVDDVTLDFCTEGCRAVVDTGTSLLSVPTPVFTQVYENLRHEAHPLLECRGPGPKLYIELEGFTVTLEPEDYSRPEASIPQTRKPGPELPPDFAGNETFGPEPEMCKPMLMSMDLVETLGPKLFVLGEPILRKYYTVYDSDDAAPRIGFAYAWHGPVPEGTGHVPQDDDDELP